MAMSRSFRRMLAHGGNATLVTVLVVVLVGVLYGIVERKRVRKDISAEGANTLQADTLKKLSLLDEDGVQVQVTGFTFQSGKEDSYFKNRAMQDLLTELDGYSASVDTHWVDFDRERLTAENLSVREYGHLVVQRGDERVDIKARELFRSSGKGDDKRLEFLGEAAFNRSVSQLLSDRRRTIYSVEGSGERDLREQGPEGYSDLVALLDNENYALESWNPRRDRDDPGAIPVVPADASALLVAAPEHPLDPAIDDAIVAYAANGGSVLILVEPGSTVPLLLERLQVVVPEGSVADKAYYAPFPDRPVVNYGRHSITSEMNELETHFPFAAPLRVPQDPPQWFQASEVLRTSRDGWIERGGPAAVGGVPIYQEAVDASGPVTWGYALSLQPGADSFVNEGKRVSRILVVGDADFTSNELLASGPGNATFAVNSFRWLVWDDARISLIGSPTAVRRLSLTTEDQDRILWMVLGMGPILVFLLGAGVWASRRGR